TGRHALLKSLSGEKMVFAPILLSRAWRSRRTRHHLHHVGHLRRNALAQGCFAGARRGRQHKYDATPARGVIAERPVGFILNKRPLPWQSRPGRDRLMSETSAGRYPKEYVGLQNVFSGGIASLVGDRGLHYPETLLYQGRVDH